MRCPKCGSENVNIQTVSNVRTKGKVTLFVRIAVISGK